MGRKKKGTRKPVCFRLPVKLIEVSKEHAEAKGLDFNTLVTRLLADATGYIDDPQGELPLAESA